MRGQYLLGIDIGTYESKGVITTPTGKVMASLLAVWKMK